ncbi:hypothetical protein ACMSE5_22130 [Bacteroides thetaiotaomicron]|uniref:hypothetical protein n=1 Tax=Bacteroides thetaiotaomicron TaxID=818 RepID=UPI001F31C416|nr:hypothetical protein [Bacteroides thetaiotaomicron]MCE9206524.1 hypothetical protein [Bacteroides thetaiotaomicron]
MRTDVEMTPLKEEIEAIFNPGNIDDDCDRIADLLYLFKVQIGELLDKGEYHEAFTLFYEILKSLSCHFVKDEHYCHFDDIHSPDYTCGDMLDTIVRRVKEGVVTESDLKYLSEAMGEVERMDAYEDYGCPFVISDWNRLYGNLPLVICITKSKKKDKI